jgi:transposase
MDERLQFVARRLAGEQMADLCREFGISRKTGYKIFDRYKECGIQGLTDRSRRPHHYAHKLPFQVENYILNVKREHTTWGARKIRERLIRRFSGIKIPAKSTIHALLDRHGIEVFNNERPHEALDMKCPADVYQASPRPYQGLPDIDYPFHDRTIVVTHCGRICLGKKKINFSQVFAGQAVGIKEVQDDIWLVSFMDYDLGYFDLETRVLEPLENPFGPKVLPM